jgi:tryptophan 2,3-dioxygenase
MIVRLLTSQFNILETMSPSSFMEFRDMLQSSSGFQSVQFRVLENKLGIKPNARIQYHNTPYKEFFKCEHANIIAEAEQGPNLLEAVNRWLQRTPYLKHEGFDFWQSYSDALLRRYNDTLNSIPEGPAKAYETNAFERVSFADTSRKSERLNWTRSMPLQRRCCRVSGGRSALRIPINRI